MKKGDIIEFGKYPQGADGSVLPIEWIVLDVNEKEALRIAQKHYMDILRDHLRDRANLNITVKSKHTITIFISFWIINTVFMDVMITMSIIFIYIFNIYSITIRFNRYSKVVVYINCINMKTRSNFHFLTSSNHFIN